jgi:hypothetical protein
MEGYLNSPSYYRMNSVALDREPLTPLSRSARSPPDPWSMFPILSKNMEWRVTYAGILISKTYKVTMA